MLSNEGAGIRGHSRLSRSEPCETAPNRSFTPLLFWRLGSSQQPRELGLGILSAAFHNIHLEWHYHSADIFALCLVLLPSRMGGSKEFTWRQSKLFANLTSIASGLEWRRSADDADNNPAHMC